MDERIKTLQQLLNDVARDFEPGEAQQFAHNFDALELPSIVSSVIRFPQSLLMPYEAAVYWYMFERSILKTGQQYCRVRGLMTGVIKSASGQSDDLASQTTRGALKSLEAKGAIIESGEPNRDGTLYRVCFRRKSLRALRQLRMPHSSPRLQRQISIRKRTSTTSLKTGCESSNAMNINAAIATKQLTRFTATLDHLQPVYEGGDNSFDNLATACLHCNSRRIARPVMDAITKVRGNEVNLPLEPTTGSSYSWVNFE